MHKQAVKKGAKAVVKTLLMAVLVFVANGCATPENGLTHTKVLHPDQEDDIGGSFLESSDIRTIAAQMTAAILSVPEVAESAGVTRIAIAPTRNSTRYIIDKDILAKRLRLELNRFSEGRVRFFASGLGQRVRSDILSERLANELHDRIDEAATALLDSSVVTESDRPLRVAVLPVKNTNLAGVNADSVTALLRARIAEKGQGKIVFLSRDVIGQISEHSLDEESINDQRLVDRDGEKQSFRVDYFLTGEFIGKSFMNEGVADVVEAYVGRSPENPGIVEGSITESRKNPNVAKYLNVNLVDAETAVVLFEILLKLDTRFTSGVGEADFVLTGEISALSKVAQGDSSDYVLVTFQLVDPMNNQQVWEDGYESKRTTTRGVVYK